MTVAIVRHVQRGAVAAIVATTLGSLLIVWWRVLALVVHTFDDIVVALVEAHRRGRAVLRCTRTVG